MGVQHRAHIEELQRYCRERDDLSNDLESKVRSQEDSVKIYKKNLEEELELHRQDKIALQRVIKITQKCYFMTQFKPINTFTSVA